ncbi:MAG: hypothetical protein HY855_03915 [Burkholderiales bacterium]|nr:hypothetical protein [Burkholderiales bacterium]
MTPIAAWFLFALGIGHTVYGLVMFRQPLGEALAAGFVGQFMGHPPRITAFWFLIMGPLLMLAGQTAAHAAAGGDQALLRLVGGYLLVIALIGVAALPKSPFWAALFVAPWLVAAGFGWIK